MLVKRAENSGSKAAKPSEISYIVRFVAWMEMRAMQPFWIAPSILSADLARFNVLSGRLSELKQQGRSVATAGGPIDIVWLERIAYALRNMVPDAWPDAASMAAQPSWRSKARDALADRLKSLAGVGG